MEEMILQELQRVGGLLTEMNGKIQVMNQKIDDLGDQVKRLDARVGCLEQRMDKMEEHLSQLDGRVNHLENMQQMILNDTKGLMEFRVEVRGRLERIENRLESHSCRIAQNEMDIRELKVKLESVS